MADMTGKIAGRCLALCALLCMFTGILSGCIGGDGGLYSPWEAGALSAEGTEAPAAISQTDSQTKEEPPEAVTQPVRPSTVEPALDVNVRLPEESEEMRVIVIGDSRSVALYCSQTYTKEEFPAHIFYNISETDYTGFVGNNVFVAKGGEGYAWLQKLGLALAEKHITQNSVLVFWMGVNDPASVDSYAAYINSAALVYGIPVCYMTLGPCEGSWAGHEAEVVAFNAALAEKLDARVQLIDTYSYIKEGMAAGTMATMDGLHYDYDTCRAVYQYMLDSISEGR